jgi:RHS repeat-associated protein
MASGRADHALGSGAIAFSLMGLGPDRAVGHRVRVRLDYSGLARGHGGSWGSRLELAELPACALTTPGMPGCEARAPLHSSNNGAGTVSAAVTLPSAAAGFAPVPSSDGDKSLPSLLSPSRSLVIAAVTTPGGAQGNYAATSLSPQGTWVSQLGDFTYSYPITMPPSIGGAAPDVTLSYSSATVDGETSAQNPQGSQIGDGWTYSPGFIEQSYEPCQLDSAATAAEAGDECWDGYNATLSLNGHSGILVGSGPGTWHLQNDDGTKIQLLTGGANGMWNGDYWLVTTTDGTKYYFGADHVPGDASSSLDTSSAWNVPVYCPGTTDPCYSTSSTTSSWTQMPYRWNLDYVVDPDSNLTVYSYTPETNYYKRGGSAGGGTLTSYVRGGYLGTISYGWRLADATASPAVLPADKVKFGSSQRCLVTSTEPCTSLTSSDQADWPDVPFDEICASSGTCANDSPTYFSEDRLTSITTEVLATQADGDYNNADTYTLTQSFDHISGSSAYVMALDSITRTGDVLMTTPLPPETFSSAMFNNRVAGTTQPAEYRPRIISIDTDSGSAIGVTYNSPACTQGSGGNITDSDAPANTLPCYPAYWAPPSDGDTMDWFDKYTVSDVAVSDQTGAASPAQVTSYSYLGGAAWHQDESTTIPSAYRTWDEYRGYASVETATGTAPDPVTETMTYYMRGMNGDANGSGGTKSVTIDGNPDNNYLAGQVLETDTYTQAGGTPDSEVINGPWTYTQTATEAPPSGSGMPALAANMLQQSQTVSRRLLASGSWQASTTKTWDNSNGLVAAVDKAPAGLPETCTSTSYATAPSGNTMMVGYPKQVTTVTGSYSSGCPAATSASIVSDTRTYYDDESATLASMGTLGSLTSPGGLETGAAQASAWPQPGSETWQNESVTQHDAYGRITSQTNANGDPTTTAYNPPTGQLPNSLTVTNPRGWVTTTSVNQRRQLPTQVPDANGEITTETYDGLGRLTSVTLPIDQGSGDPTYKYSYSMTGTAPPSVTTQTLREDGSYAQDVKIYDGMLQLRQEQTTTADNEAGRLITDTYYDSHGWVVKTSDPYYDSSSSPGTTLFLADQTRVPSQTVTTFDGQGRPVSSAFWSDGVQQWQTTTSYPGMDVTSTTPPPGGTPTSVTTNSAGQTAQSLYGASDTTSYAYTPAGQVASVSDNNGDEWTDSYNLLGQKTASTDPGTTGSSGPSGQAGTTAYTYDGDGNLTSVTDPDGNLVSYTYDDLDRKTAEYSGTPATGAEKAKWIYDTLEKGQLTSSTSYDSAGGAWTEAVTGYNAAYEPAGTTTTVPADQGTLASTYTTATNYTPLTGLPEDTSYGADAGLQAEDVGYTYDLQGLLTQNGGNADYLDNTTYDPEGQVLQTTFGPSGEQLVQTYAYDAGTQRLLTSTTSLQTLGAAADTTSYTYDDAGNPTSESDAQGTGGTQTQCFTYNSLDQLTAAWTDTGGTTTTTTTSGGGQSVQGIGGCADATPAAASIGGPAPYWETWTYDLLGDRTSQTSYDTSLPASQDTLANATTQEITYPGGNLTSSPSSNATTIPQAQPDAPAQIVTTSPGGSTTTIPAYDDDGSTTSLTSTSTGNSPPPGPPGLAKVTYNALGQAVTAQTAAGTSTYAYDASGNIIGIDSPAGDTVIVDGGAEQLTHTTASSGSTSGVRYVPGPDGTLSVVSSPASGSADTVSYEVTGQQGTATEDIAAATGAITRRYYDPYGNPVGTAPASWPDGNAFLGKPSDPATTLDLLGPRQYDPATGSFLTLDPVFESGSPLQMGGYAYAAGNPVADTDPTGTCAAIPEHPCVGTQPGPSGGGGGGSGSGGGGVGSTGGGGDGGSGATGDTPPPATVIGTVALPSTYPRITQIQKIYGQTYQGGLDQRTLTAGAQGEYQALFLACEAHPAVCGSALADALMRGGASGMAVTSQDYSAFKKSGQSPVGWLSSHSHQLVWQNSMAASAAVGGIVPLFRTMGAEEAADIASSGAFRSGPGLEGKYFFQTRQQAENLAGMFSKYENQTLATGQISSEDLTAYGEAVNAAGEGPAVWIPTEALPLISNVNLEGPIE